jgi:hypothetical protein
MTEASVVGVYPLAAHESCYLIEVALVGVEHPVDFGDFGQPVDNVDPMDAQAPWMEWVLDATGLTALAGPWEPLPAESWHGDLRLAFHVHYLDVTRSLASPFGELALPTPSERPARLDALEYLPPD